MSNHFRLGAGMLGWLLMSICAAAWAKEDIEFVAEHLPEVAMDDRYATLPIWSGSPAEGFANAELQGAFASTTASNLNISGPLLSLGARWSLTQNWQFGGFAFYDALNLRAGHESRDLQTLFAPSTPIARPVAAQFSHLDGTARDLGAGLFVALRGADTGPLGAHTWIGGLLWQQVTLSDYRFDYRILAGPDAGTRGQIDFDARYRHVVPFLGLNVPRHYGRWSANAHVLFAYPEPRRGFVGHITGPGFNIHGDTEKVGNGKHFGDPWLAFGYGVTYEPLHLTVDLGALASQLVLEPRVHRGIGHNLMLSFSLGL